jgi:hypothetical protein
MLAFDHRRDLESISTNTAELFAERLHRMSRERFEFQQKTRRRDLKTLAPVRTQQSLDSTSNNDADSTTSRNDEYLYPDSVRQLQLLRVWRGEV